MDEAPFPSLFVPFFTFSHKLHQAAPSVDPSLELCKENLSTYVVSLYFRWPRLGTIVGVFVKSQRSCDRVDDTNPRPRSSPGKSLSIFCVRNRPASSSFSYCSFSRTESRPAGLCTCWVLVYVLTLPVELELDGTLVCVTARRPPTNASHTDERVPTTTAPQNAGAGGAGGWDASGKSQALGRAI